MARLGISLFSVVAVLWSASAAEATFPGRNGTIAFAARGPGEAKSLWRIEPTGESVRRLIPGAGGEDRAPAWSRDGRTLAFASSRSGNLDIWSVRPGSGVPPVNLTRTPGEDELLPSWSPSGRIAFTSQEIGTGHVSIDVTDTDGSSRVSIATLTAPVSLEWSPTGGRIAYSVADAGSRDIYTVRPDGSAPTRVANDLPQAVIYDISPDGRRILFQGGPIGSSGLFEVAVGGRHRIRRLTKPSSPVTDGHASYSPNGRMVVFVRDTERGEHLSLMRANGANQRILGDLGRLSAYGISWQARQAPAGR